MNRLNLIGRRIIAWPLIVIGLILAYLSSWLIMFGAWLTDHEDVVAMVRNSPDWDCDRCGEWPCACDYYEDENNLS